MFKTVIWATDGSEAADASLPYAKEIVSGGALVVVHCKELLTGRGGSYPVLADDDELQAKISEQVETLRGEGLDVSLRLASSHASGAAHVIADVANEIGADAIVVGTRGHATISGLLLGSVTHRLLHIAPCAVLAVPSRVVRHDAAKAEREVAVEA
jgi:nucleotide-binding universal stress UspA family protein